MHVQHIDMDKVVLSACIYVQLGFDYMQMSVTAPPSDKADRYKSGPQTTQPQQQGDGRRPVLAVGVVLPDVRL